MLTFLETLPNLLLWNKRLGELLLYYHQDWSSSLGLFDLKCLNYDGNSWFVFEIAGGSSLTDLCTVGSNSNTLPKHFQFMIDNSQMLLKWWYP